MTASIAPHIVSVTFADEHVFEFVRVGEQQAKADADRYREDGDAVEVSVRPAGNVEAVAS